MDLSSRFQIELTRCILNTFDIYVENRLNEQIVSTEKLCDSIKIEINMDKVSINLKRVYL